MRSNVADIFALGPQRTQLNGLPETRFEYSIKLIDKSTIVSQQANHGA